MFLNLRGVVEPLFLLDAKLIPTNINPENIRKELSSKMTEMNEVARQVEIQTRDNGMFRKVENYPRQYC